MHVKTRQIAFGGLLLAITILCMILGSVIETNTLFLLAAASYFVGIVLREFGNRTGAAFYLAAVLLGFLIAPNKFYVISFALMGGYILAVELIWKQLGKLKQETTRKKNFFWILKYLIFNILYIPAVLLAQQLLFGRTLSGWMLLGVIAAGQIGLFIYDYAYEYVQSTLWSKMRGKILG